MTLQAHNERYWTIRFKGTNKQQGMSTYIAYSMSCIPFSAISFDCKYASGKLTNFKFLHRDVKNPNNKKCVGGFQNVENGGGIGEGV